MKPQALHFSESRKIEIAADRVAARKSITGLQIVPPYEVCPEPNCDHGWIAYFDAANATRWWEQCMTCEGRGVVYVHEGPEIAAWLRACWQRIGRWTPPRWLRLTVGTLGCLLLIAALGTCLWLWMVL